MISKIASVAVLPEVSISRRVLVERNSAGGCNEEKGDSQQSRWNETYQKEH